MGKTTLLNHIAEKKLAIPPRIDVLLCEQEVEADDTPAIDAVLKADAQRLALMEEERVLLVESEAGNDSRSERLKEVCGGGCVLGVLPLDGMVCMTPLLLLPRPFPLSMGKTTLLNHIAEKKLAIIMYICV